MYDTVKTYDLLTIQEEERMDFSLTEEQKIARNAAREFMNDTDVVRLIADTEKTKNFSARFMRKAAGMGYLGMNVAEEYGGVEMSPLDAAIILEEIAYAYIPFSLCVLVHNSLSEFSLERFGSEDLTNHYLPRMVEGEIFGCFANTEEEAGADGKNIQTKAALVNDTYILNGTKKFITNASVADVATVATRTAKRKTGQPGITTFFLDINSAVPGFSLDRKEQKSAQPGTELCQFTLTDFKTDESRILGTVGGGWNVVRTTFEHSRIQVAAQAIGGARRAFDETLKRTSMRKTFGKRLIDHQSIEFNLSDLYTQIEAARLLTYRAAHAEGEGKEFGVLSSMAKYAAGGALERALYLCYKYFGGASVVDEMPPAKLNRDGRIIPTYEGPEEIQLMIIGDHLKKLAASMS